MKNNGEMASSKSMRTELDFEKLPGIPGFWLDFLNSRLPITPAPRDMESLAAGAGALREQAAGCADLVRFLEKAADLHCARTQENIHRLLQPGSLAVSTTLSPGLFGGPAFQLLKCLTVLKVCEELARHRIAAVPICWIRDSAPVDFCAGSIQLLDSDSSIHLLQLQNIEAGSLPSRALLPENQVEGLLEQISEIGRNNFDPETIDIIRASFRPGIVLSEATAKLMAALTEDWGMIVLNHGAPDFPSCTRASIPGVTEGAMPAYVLQSLLTPAVVCVIDYSEIEAYMDAQQTFRALNLLPPLAWPCSGATIVEVRSRRILERYGLDLIRLYSGAEEIIESLCKALPMDVPGRLLDLNQEAGNRVDAVRNLYPSDHDFEKVIAPLRNRIGFQLNRLREKYDASRKGRQETMERHIHRVCNTLAPNRRMQERSLAGVQWPLRYSRNVLRSLYDRLEVLRPQHQLILMD